MRVTVIGWFLARQIADACHEAALHRGALAHALGRPRPCQRGEAIGWDRAAAQRAEDLVGATVRMLWSDAS